MTEEKTKLGINELKQKLEECEKLKSEYLANWQRERADFLNYKKEELGRIGELIKYADIGIILKILPILDNFRMALKEIQDPKSKVQNSEEIIKGFLQIKNQISELLKNQGVEEIKSVGDKFDPNLHETVEEIESGDKEAGIILEETQKGYTINGRLLRPAKVKVSK